MRTDKVLVIAGRPGIGKTEQLIAYANRENKKTLFFSLEKTEKDLKKQGIKSDVIIIDEVKIACEKLINTIKKKKILTICIDYFELMSDELASNLIKTLFTFDIKIIIATQLRRGTLELNPKLIKALSKYGTA